MPQMSPMLWLLIFFFIIMFVTLISMIIYSLPNIPALFLMKKKEINQKKWMW